MAFEKLFQPLAVAGVTFKNRIVFPPCVVNFGGLNGEVTDTSLAYYEARARGGAGTVIVEAAYVRPDGKVEPGELGAHEDALIPGLRRLATAIHRHGAVALLQINHCGRQAKARILGCQPVSSSAVPSPVMKDVPRELSVPEVQEMVAAYAAAAARAQQAGFDGVELHGAHGYLIAQFMSPYVNRRDDEYGGDAARRMRFPLEIIAAIRHRCGERFVIFFRFSADEYVPGGLTLEETRPNAQRLEAAGVDVLHVSAGVYETGHIFTPLASHPRGSLVHLAEAIKQVAHAPVVTVGKITDPEFAEGILQAGRADMVAIGRGLMADPDFPQKAATGRANEIQKCIGCRNCLRTLFRGNPVACSVNPALGKELLFEQPAPGRRSVVVVGDGAGALQAAWVAALRGHEVTLWAGSGPLGGKLANAAGPKNDEAATVVKFIASRLPRVGVAVRRGNGREIAHPAFDAVIVEGSAGVADQLVAGLPLAGVGRQTIAACEEPRGLMAALDEGTLAALAI